MPAHALVPVPPRQADPVAVLRRAFGYPGFRPGQEELVRAVVGGRDALGVLPTGGGKSVCYQVPALMLDGLTLVVTPLVSLMEDQVGRARAIGLPADCLSGTQSSGERASVAERVRARATRLLFVSPERLDLEAFTELLASVPVDLVAVDEAHCISEWGHDFRPAYRRIGRLRDLLGCPMLALTASATPEVRADILASLGLDHPLEVVRSFDRPNLWWAVEPGRTLAERARAIRRILKRTGGVSIVYAPTRRSVEMVRDYLAARGHRCDAYHAGLPGEERTLAQERFMSGESRVVVATNAFGMGIDKADVRAVVHLQLPATLESYYQEAGRAGRDGEPSTCVAFHAPTDRRLAERFIERTHPQRRLLRRALRALRHVADAHGVAHITDPRVTATLDASPREWMEGEPVGVLGALERIGAIRRLAPEPRPDPDGREVRPVLVTTRVGVLSRADLEAAARLRLRARDKLRAVMRYARTRRCRRNEILRYFGEESEHGCGQCDRCGWVATAAPRER